MKNILLTIFITISSFCLSQNIKVVQLTNGGIFVESSRKVESFMGSTITENNKSFYVGSNDKKSLISGVQKAIEWAELNKTHNKEFEKEITRIRVMEKESYLFYKKFISEFLAECILNFYGIKNGDFKVSLGCPNISTSIKLESINDLKNLKNILNGKSGNSEIDNIFK